MKGKKRKTKKKLLIFTILMAIFLFSNQTGKVYANEQKILNLENYIINDECVTIQEEVEVYGNILEVNNKDFMDIIDNGTDKIYIHYRTNYDIELPYDLLVIVKNNNELYHYEYLVKNENSDDENYLFNGIKNYLIMYKNEICKNYYNEIDDAVICFNSSVPTTFIDSVATANFTTDFPKKGYITSRIAVSEYRANSNSSIFIIKVISSFVPGYVAKENGANYDPWRNDNGYVHITVGQAMDRNEEYYYGIRYGAIPYLKDYWPLNQPSTVTISSSFDAGLTLGYSQNNGFGVDLDLISYGYSKAITYSNPTVNAQLSSDLKTAQWSYVYDKNRPWTYDQESNYMYEISSSGNNMIYGDVRLTIDYKFVVDRGFPYSQQKNYTTLDLMVRPTQSKIWHFSNGMI